ncbi:hypothetical protein KOR34_26740 [Posidoniimonas corsicana]|uniref:PEP-CTERM protein-sorting domain-containing protein n=1 Tax=Posidoniimonas corsicana TaxID=1938618 RepID=A0A5C5VJ31_9BACT|nr:hypothetical protein [Posidoniimonas corsicana]TWT37712.1 hypothetical protein KOR34_26740 [Posidoniimonas corsicana]
MKSVFAALAAMAIAASGQLASAAPFLTPADDIFAIDTDGLRPTSNYPAGENPGLAFDDDTGTKYLNFGGANSGLIVTPSVGSTTVRSLLLTTANDAPDRDPTSFALYGTNDAVTSVDNGLGLSENWSLITGSAVSLPADRLMAGPVMSFPNSNAYTSYRLLFPTVNGSSLMQISEVSLFESTDGTGSDVLTLGDAAIAFDHNLVPDSNYPAAESPANLIDGTLNKYLNFGKANSGFIVTPTAGAQVLKAIEIKAANDAVERDPTRVDVYGTNDVINSTDNSTGEAEAWTLIDTASISLSDVRPTDFNAPGTFVAINNDTAYSSYRVVFPELKDAPNLANSMQIAEIQFYNAAVPEPTAAGMVVLSCLGLGVHRGRRS